MLCFKTLSNGASVVFVEPNDLTYSFSLLSMNSLGKYLYHHSYGRSVKLYQNGIYTEFFDAYKSGMIDDAIVEELNDVMHFDRYADVAEPSPNPNPEPKPEPKPEPIIIPSDRDVDELPSERVELSDAEKLKMAQDYKAQYETEGDPQQYTVLCFKTLSNGMKLVYVKTGEPSTDNIASAFDRIGKYGYHHERRTVLLYKDGVYTTFYDAYQNGLIDDALLDEIHDVMHFDVYVEPTAEPTQADETKADDTQSATQQESRKKDTPDKPATPDSSTNSNATPTNSAVIQTGSVQLAVLFLAMLTIAAFIVVFLKKRKAY